MKATFIFFFLSIGTAQVFAAEHPDIEAAAGSDPKKMVMAQAASEDRDEGIDADWKLIETPSSPAIAPYKMLMIRKIITEMDASSTEHLPVEYFLIERPTGESIKVYGGFYAKYAALTTTNLLSYIPRLSVGFLWKSVSFSVASSYADQVARGDSENFPPLKLQYFVDLLQSKGVQDRQSFARIPAEERSFDFEAYARNGFLGKGYKGRLVLMGFVCGKPLVDPAGVPAVLSQYGDQAIEHLISVTVHQELIDLIGKAYHLPSTMEFTPVGQVWKNSGLYTCSLYMLYSQTFAIYVHGMRVPDEEFKRAVTDWKEIHRFHHAAVNPSAAIVSTDSGVTHSDSSQKVIAERKDT